MSSLRAKVGIQFLVSNGATAAQFGLSVILARLLSPSEVGIFSITAVVVGFTHVFRDFGVVSFIKRQKTLTPEGLMAASGVLYTSSWTIALLLYLSSGFWADYFGQPGIRDIMPVLALGFVFIPFGAVPQAVLSRDMDVNKTASVTVLATAVYICTCISLAYLGFSYMSMAWANLANIVVSGIAFTFLMPRGLPQRPGFRGWKKVVQFGTGAMLTSSLRAIDAALPDILLGKLSGPHAVGIFSRANSTVNILNTLTGPTVQYFALPYLAKVHHQGYNLGNEIGRTAAYLTGLIWPALLATAFMASDLIRFLYGPTWLESASVVPWLCVIAAVQVSFSVIHPALTGMGRPYLTAIPFTFVVLAKIGLVLALFDGKIETFGKAVAIAECSTVPAYLFLSHRILGLSLIGWLRWIRPSLWLVLVTAVQIGVLYWVLPAIELPFFRLLAAGLWIGSGWLAAVMILEHPLHLEIKALAAKVRIARPMS